MKTTDEKLQDLITLQLQLKIHLKQNVYLIVKTSDNNLIATGHVLELAGKEIQKAINYIEENIKRVKENL